MTHSKPNTAIVNNAMEKQKAGKLDGPTLTNNWKKCKTTYSANGIIRLF